MSPDGKEAGGVWGCCASGAELLVSCLTSVLCGHHGATQEFYEEESDRLEFSVRENRNLV